MLTKETTYSNLRANLATILDQVYDQSQIMVINRRNGKNIALIAENELSSLLECVYLLRCQKAQLRCTPENAQKLFDSLAWAKETEQESQTVTELKQELGIESKKA